MYKKDDHGDEFRMVCCATAGVGNRARAGKNGERIPRITAELLIRLYLLTAVLHMPP
jgi:hypothetical protein